MWRQFLRVSSGVAVAWLLLSAATLSANAAEQVTLGTVGKGNTLAWPLYIGLEKDMFSEAGVELDIVYVSSNAQLEQQLAAGSIDLVVASGLVDPLRAISHGAPVGIIRIDAQTPPYSLLANPEINSIEDLRGKTIIVGGAHDITRTYLERMLEPKGLSQGDYDLIYAGSTAARFAALQAGSADAAILFPPANFTARDLGFTHLGDVVDYAPDLPFAGTVVNRNWAEENKLAIENFQEAYSAAIDWFYDQNNREEAIDIMTTASGADRENIATSYEFLQDIEAFGRTSEVSRKKLNEVRQILINNDEIEESALSVEDLVIPGVTELTE